MRSSRAKKIAVGCPGVDAVVISNGVSPFLDPLFRYLTEQTSGTFEGSFAVVSKDGSLDIVTSPLEETTAKKGSGNVHVYEKREERDSLLSGLLKGCGRIGICGRSVTYNASEYIRKIGGAELVDVSSEISGITAIKDAKEISDIRKAAAISSKTASRIPEMLRSGMTEKELAKMIDLGMVSDGGAGNAFETICAFGPNSAEPHHHPSDRKIKKGNAALFDFGSKYGMYCSDLTRTVFFGEPEEILERAYEVVLTAKNAGMTELYDGAPAKNADLIARDIIDDSEFKGMFIHSFGHGMGMNIHESPAVSSRSDDVLKKGMVVSAEPGIYIPGIGGIRIEDSVLITKNGFEELTEFDEGFTVI